MATEAIKAAIRTAARKYNVPEDLALAVAERESSFNPGAISDHGAIGLFQLMPKTAAGLGVDPYDPTQNIDGGVRYLAENLRRFGGDVGSALAAYNFGPTAVARGDSWPAETRRYVAWVFAKLGVAADSSTEPLPLPRVTADDLFARVRDLAGGSNDTAVSVLLMAAATAGAVGLGALMLRGL